MKILKEFFAHSLRILLGALFIFSGYIKLYPIEPFELNFIDLGVANWWTAPVIARAIIGFEMFLGVMLIFDLKTKRFTIPATFGVLIFFTLYLVYQIITTGNQGNCGCFGTYLEMTPLESIFKNIGLLSILIVIQFIPATYDYDFLKKKILSIESDQAFITTDSKWNFLRKELASLILVLSIIGGISVPYILNPPDALFYNHRAGAVNFPLRINDIFKDTSVTKPPVDLEKGRHIVAFMSLSCFHCQMTALKIHTIQKRNPDFPFFLILNGDTARYKKKFFEFSKAQNIPHLYYNSGDFFSYVGGSVPKVYWLQNDTVKYHSLYSDLNENEIRLWLEKGIVPSQGDTLMVGNDSN